MHRAEYTVRTIAFVLILWGLYEIIRLAESVWLVLLHGFSTSDTDLMILSFHVFLVFSVVIPLIAIIAGWGLLRIRRWAHLLALSVCAYTFVVTFLLIINSAVQSYYAHNIPVPEIPEGAVVEYYSMWPEYITGLVSGILILVLKRGPIKSLFVRKGYA